VKQILLKSLLVLGSIIAALVLGEVGLGLLGIEYPRFYEADPNLGSRLRPGMEGYWLEEGGGYFRVNSEGLRDREHSLTPAPNTLRIAVLGDSFAEAKEVDREEAFWAIMEKGLQGCGNLGQRQVEVINFGQSGFGTTQELLALRHRVWKYSPDVVLVAFFTGNDVADNFQAFRQWYLFPYFTYEDGELVLHDRHTRKGWEVFEESEKTLQKVWWLRWKRWLADNSRVYQLIGHSQKRWALWRDHMAQRGQAAAVSEAPEPGLFSAVYREPDQEVWQEAWKITEASLLTMRDEVEARGARFFVVVLSTGMQVHPDPAARKKYADWIGSQDLLYPDRRLAAFCRREGMPILLLAPAFQKYASEHRVFLHGFGDTQGGGHWNETGHRLAGKMMAEWLCGQLN